MAKSSEERVANRFLDAFGKIDFKSEEFAYYITRAGTAYQSIMWSVFRNMIMFWAMDWEKGEHKNSAEYHQQTLNARAILELIERQEMEQGR